MVIATTLIKRDGKAAARAMEAHLDVSMNALINFAAKHPKSFEMRIRDYVAA